MMRESDYRALPALSGTGVASLLASPADWLWKQEHPTLQTPAMAFGTLVHALTLGNYTEEEDPYRFEAVEVDPNLVISPFDSFRKAEARAWRDEKIENGLEPISHSAYQTLVEKAEAATLALQAKKDDAHARARTLADAVHAHSVAGRLLSEPGNAEVVVSGTYNGARLKGRIDWLPDDGPVTDLKTARDVGLRAMSHALDSFGYATQLAHYGLLADRLERPKIIAVRNEQRPAVAVYRLGQSTWDAALRATERAWEIYAECVKTGVWPDPHADRMLDVDAPYWTIDRLNGNDLAEDTITALENMIGETNE
jgi:hypothetical protein